MKYLVAALAGYAIGWTVSYVFVMGSDFRYFLAYLRLAWTQPGERPAFIQLGAIAVALVAPLCLWGWLRIRAKR